MLVLGIHGGQQPESEELEERFHDHDSGAVLMDENGVIAAVEEERLSRLKHTNRFPRRAVAAVLKQAGVTLDDVSWIALPKEEIHFTVKGLVQAFNSATVEVRGAKQLAALSLQREFGRDTSEKLCFVPHHLCHLWSAFGVSGFDSSLVISLDGGGAGAGHMGFDFGMAAVGQGQHLEVLNAYNQMSSSLGLYYVALIHLLGYRLFDEYKVMGLAPYGDAARFAPFLESTYKLLPEGNFHVRTGLEVLEAAVEGDMVEHLRRKGEPFNQAHKDLAAGIQATFEKLYFHVIEHYRQKTGQKRLCLAGGSALNCTANGKLHQMGLFEDIFVQPASHDAGCALGAAIATLKAKAPASTKTFSLPHLYWGTDIGTDADIQRTLRKWEPFVSSQPLPNPAQHAAKLLAEGAVVAWVQGRSEFGPRALGHRSIVADPRPEQNKTRINAMVKKREGYRPFAPSVPEERVREYFVVGKNHPDFSFMTFTVDVLPEQRSKLGAITHVDGSARIQTVRKSANPLYWELLESFGKLSGVPILLNTSFNNNVEPIVETVDDALIGLLTTDIDALVVGNLLVTKKPLERGDARLRSLVPHLPLGRKLTRKWSQEGSTTQDVYSLDSTSSRGQFEPDPFLYESPVEVSKTMFLVLSRADGVKTFEELCVEQQIQAPSELAQLSDEIAHVWEERALHLVPR